MVAFVSRLTDLLLSIAIISVHDKKGIVQLANALISSGKVQIAASDGTYDHLINNGVPASSVTGFSELLGGRVKTLHPSIFAGGEIKTILDDMTDLLRRNFVFPLFRFVVCNFYPFEETVSAPRVADKEALANIDIGGVALLRAAAKNYQFVTVVSDLSDYSLIINEITSPDLNGTTLETRQMLAVKAFQWTSFYDSLIADYMRITYLGQKASLSLRYGMNPHQNFARAFPSSPRAVQLPFAVLNGAPGFINILDALNSWQLVSELRKIFNVPAAASFKHVSPAGAAIAGKLSDVESEVYMIDDVEHMTPLAVAYAKARGCDRLSSYGDFVALSDICDFETAQLISKEVSDGVIAPGYHPKALELLRRKKKGSFCILHIDADYVPDELELRTVFGINMKQQRNNAQITKEKVFEWFGSESKGMTDEIARDLTLAAIAVKYAQSNSVCLAKNGQTIGIGAGQQSRIGCVRLACEKAENWWLRFHPNVLDLKFAHGVKRADKNNAVDAFVRSTTVKLQEVKTILQSLPTPLSAQERRHWLSTLHGVSLCSDGFFPFVDCILRSLKTGVQSILVPSGSVADQSIVNACEAHNVLLVFTDTRLFHH
ncbi:bifunctional purine biosynthesis protein [Trichuris trichiura]|uniref:Bifunctional purine biosynthesis protein ATIC n=1 Tax=Trichuris trichiura TaxID=36087 RepID=A0A077Z6Z8_TRITR|nr:bifunctional purine biosynthesis protein [Trichuris trichiura]